MELIFKKLHCWLLFLEDCLKFDIDKRHAPWYYQSMKDMLRKVRADKDFNLETLSYEEIFDGLKFGIARAISGFSKLGIYIEDLELNLEGCLTRKAYGEDMNLYPKIYLNLKGDYSVLLTPFEIELLRVGNGIKSLSCDELTISLLDFMQDKFPDCDYIKIYENYQKNAEIIKKQREKHLFL